MCSKVCYGSSSRKKEERKIAECGTVYSLRLNR